MVTTLFANNKGGVGKTTLSVLLAHHLHGAGHRVLVSDWDDQSNLSATIKESGKFECRDLSDWIQSSNPELPAAASVALTASDALVELGKDDLRKIKKNIARVSDRFDYHILDVPPGAGARMFLSIHIADTIFVPLLPTQYSLNSATRFLSWLSDMRSASKFAGFILNQVRPQDTVAASIRDALGDQIVAELKVRRHLEASIADHAGKIHWGLKSGSNRDAVREIQEALAKITDKL